MTTDAHVNQPSKKKKRINISKNRKKAWGKHSDVTEIEDFLEEQRLQERTGGIVADKSDDKLFFVDKSVTEEPEESGKSSQRRRRTPKLLKCEANLRLDPRIPAARISHNAPSGDATRHRSQRVRDLLSEGHVTVQQKTGVAQRKVAKRQNWQRNVASKVAPLARYDLWNTEETVEGDDHYLRVTRRKRRKVPANYIEKPSAVPAVEVAHPGASYNPSYEDHQALLEMALVVEVNKEREERKIERALDDMFPDRKDAPTQASWIGEMSAGLYDDSGSEDDDDDAPSAILAPTVRRGDKKSIRDRKRTLQRRAEEKKRKQQKVINRRDNDFFRIKSIKSTMRDEAAEVAERAKTKADVKLQKRDEPKKLGKLKFEAAELEIKLTDELQGSLRLLKPEGNLLSDRFNSLQKRNMIETRLRAKFKRKYRPKEFEKKGHKAIVL